MPPMPQGCALERHPRLGQHIDLEVLDVQAAVLANQAAIIWWVIWFPNVWVTRTPT